MIPTPELLASLEQKNGLPQGLLGAVMQAESAGNPNAKSPAGALGAFQFMPDTAAQYGIDPFNAEQSAGAAAQMFGELSKKYQGDVPSMLAGYNWGQGNVDRKGLQNAPTETRNYIEKIQPQLAKQYADSGQIMNDASQLPPLPEGFQLDVPAASNELPPLPEGFVLDSEATITPPVAQEPSIIDNAQQTVANGLQGIQNQISQSPFMGRMEADFNKRKAQVSDAEGQLASGDINPVSKAYRVVGANLGLAGDYVGNVVGSGARYAGDALKAIADPLIDDKGAIAMAEAFGYGKDTSKEVGGALANTGVGRGIKGIAKYAGEKYNEFAQAHPEAAGNISASGSYLNALPFVKPVASATAAVAPAVKEGVELLAAPVINAGAKVGSGVASVATAPVKGVALRVKGYNALAGDDLKALVKAEGKKTTDAYKAVDKTGTVVSKNSVKSLEDKIDAKLAETDLDAEFQPKTIAALRVLKNNIKDKSTGSGQINLGKLDQFRRLLGRAISPEDKLVAAQLRDVLDNHLDELVDTDLVGGTKDSINALNEARATASRGFAVEKIAKIIKKADGDDNAIRKGFTKFLEDDKNLRGFSEAEKAAFKQASQNTGAQAVEKFLGRFGIDGKGGVLPTLAAGTTAGGVGLAVPAAIPAVAVGSAAKYTRKLAARGDAQKALEAVLNRKITKEDLQKAFEAKKGNR